MRQTLPLRKLWDLFDSASQLRTNKKVVRADSSPPNVDAIQSRGKLKDKRVESKPTRQTRKMNPITDPEMCTRCGKHSHVGKQQCSARDATCRKYHKRGHFQVVCRTKTVRVVPAEDSEEDSFIGAIEQSESLMIPTISTGSEPWTVTDELPVEFQIDTGADVSVIPEQLYRKLKVPSLEPTNKSLIGPSQDSLHVCGQFNATLIYKGSTVKEQIYVVRGLRKALIGRPAITVLQLLCRVNKVDSIKQKVVSRFPQLFKGLGTIEGEYNIMLKQDAIPYALSTP